MVDALSSAALGPRDRFPFSSSLTNLNMLVAVVQRPTFRVAIVGGTVFNLSDAQAASTYDLL
jgi:hypothetical protein